MPLLVFVIVYSKDSITVFIKRIIAELIPNITDQRKEDSDADGEPDDVDGSEELTTNKISNGGDPIVF